MERADEQGLMNNWAVMVPDMDVTTKPVKFEKNALVFGDVVVTKGRKLKCIITISTEYVHIDV